MKTFFFSLEHVKRQITSEETLTFKMQPSLYEVNHHSRSQTRRHGVNKVLSIKWKTVNWQALRPPPLLPFLHSRATPPDRTNVRVLPYKVMIFLIDEKLYRFLNRTRLKLTLMKVQAEEDIKIEVCVTSWLSSAVSSEFRIGFHQKVTSHLDIPWFFYTLAQCWLCWDTIMHG